MYPVQPTNPAAIEIKDFSKGSGTGWGATASSGPPTANIYYYFIPDATGKWNLSAHLIFMDFILQKQMMAFLPGNLQTLN